jgi:hypothetical protein
VQFEFTSIVVYQISTTRISTEPEFVHYVTDLSRCFVKDLYILSVVSTCCLLPLSELGTVTLTVGSSTISNQLVVVLIIVRHLKSILEPSLPLRV